MALSCSALSGGVPVPLRAQGKGRGAAVSSHLSPSRLRRSSRSSSSASRRIGQSIVHAKVHPIVHPTASLTPLCTSYSQLEAAEVASAKTSVPLPLCARMCGRAAAVEQQATVRSSVHRPMHCAMQFMGYCIFFRARPAAAAAEQQQHYKQHMTCTCTCTCACACSISISSSSSSSSSSGSSSRMEVVDGRVLRTWAGRTGRCQKDGEDVRDIDAT